jgi:hypothetical protein
MEETNMASRVVDLREPPIDLNLVGDGCCAAVDALIVLNAGAWIHHTIAARTSPGLRYY